MNSARPDVRYGRARAIVHEVLDIAPAQRATLLVQRCGEDAELLAEVRWLLAAAEDESLDTVPNEIRVAAGEIAAEQRLQASIPGQYRLIEAIGEGGMGVVWLAERTLGGACQKVALKRLHSGTMTHRARLVEEQRILGSLVHPNIARLLDAGEDHDGVPFLAIEYVDGERIDQWCVARKLDLRARIKLFIKTCDAVSYAHQQLVIHRDIKPANVLVDLNAEPKLLDFGIARLIDADGQRTSTRFMTPAYASPEQIEGKPLGTATDVWSLGVMLHELLTGSRPVHHLSEDHARALAMLSGEVQTTSQRDAEAAKEAAPSPRALRVPVDVDAIVRKALRREPDKRYASVRELAEDLERFLDARPVLARRGERTYRARRFVERNRWPILGGLFVAVLIAGFTWRTALAERDARLQAEVAERTTEFLISAFALSDPTQAGRHDYSAREVLDRGLQRIDTELTDLPQVRAKLLEALGNAYRGINEGSAGAPLLEAAAQLNLEIDQPLAAARSLQAKAAAVMAVRTSSEIAEDAAQRAFELVQTHAPTDSLQLAEAYGILAEALNATGKEARAVAVAREALRLRETAQADPLVLARSHGQLCAVMSSAGDTAAALPHCERSVAMYASGGATRTDAYRQALRDLDLALSYLGQHERSFALVRERMALTADLFGEDSAMLASERVWLTVRFGEHGLFAEARELLAQGMPVILARNGPDSTQYARALFCQGWLSFQQGQFEKALPPMRRAVEIQNAQVKGRDLGTLHVLRTTLAQVLIESGQANDEARELLESVLRERLEAGSTANALAYSRLPLAQWHAAHGEAADARLLLDQVSAVGAGVEKELHARVAATRSALFAADGDGARAATEAQSAFQIMKEDRGDAHPLTVRYALIYARSLEAIGRRDEARALRSRYQSMLAQIYPRDSHYRQSTWPSRS